MADLTNAMAVCDVTYNELVAVANGIIERCTSKLDEVVGTIYGGTEGISNEAVRQAMLNLSLLSYSFSEIKEKAAMKAECAEVLRKEKYAKQFNNADGSVASRENTATLNVSEEILVETIYNMVASVLKVKLDEAHRVVDTLKSVLTSRLAEAKLASVSDAVQDF